MFDIKNLNDEYFLKLDKNELLDVKSLSTEDKVLCFKFFLDSEVIDNKYVLANIYIILMQDVSIINFDNNDVFFNSIEEYNSMKYQLKFEIKDFSIYILENYFGIIKGISYYKDNKDITLLKYIPRTYASMMSILKIIDISRMVLSCIDSVSQERARPVHDAVKYYNLINTDITLSDFLTSC